jgi:rSAM/selenodomain-associated transferase 2
MKPRLTPLDTSDDLGVEPPRSDRGGAGDAGGRQPLAGGAVGTGGVLPPPTGVASRSPHRDGVRPALCIVMPVLDEAQLLAPRLLALQQFRQRGARLVVVDGGSDDDTVAIARAHADLVVVAPRGRAAQMNAGAAACPADVLLFVHADTALPEDADELVRRATQGPFAWGRFDVRIAGDRRLLRMVSRMMNLRSRWTGIATGDQAIFVRQDLFRLVGGFPDLPLMEDVAISRLLKRRGPPACLNAQVVTSARRWEHQGVWRTILLMWRLRAAYFLGADPGQLAIRYGYRPR